MAGLTIGKFAAAEGVSVETVRFYQRKGLLSQPDRQRGGYREYTASDRWRLAFIRRARQLGFTLGEIAELLGPAQDDLAQHDLAQDDLAQHDPVQARSTEEIQRAAEAKLAAVAGQITELSELACKLRRLVQVCAHGDSAACLTLQIQTSQLQPERA